MRAGLIIYWGVGGLWCRVWRTATSRAASTSPPRRSTPCPTPSSPRRFGSTSGPTSPSRPPPWRTGSPGPPPWRMWRLLPPQPRPLLLLRAFAPPLRESERPLAWLLSLGCTHQEGDVVLMGRAAPACTSTTPPPVQPPPPAPTPASAPIPSAPTRDAPQAAVDGPVEQQPAPPPSAAATAAAAVVDGTAPVETADDPTVPMETADDPKPV